MMTKITGFLTNEPKKDVDDVITPSPVCDLHVISVSYKYVLLKAIQLTLINQVTCVYVRVSKYSIGVYAFYRYV